MGIAVMYWRYREVLTEAVAQEEERKRDSERFAERVVASAKQAEAIKRARKEKADKRD